jgi:cardiolipin synthase
MIYLWIFVFSHTIGLITSIFAVMSTRTPQGSVAWAVSLNTFPYLAVPAYWVLGRSRFQGYTAARHGKLKEIAGVSEEAAEAARRFISPPEMMTGGGRGAEKLTGIPYLMGNSVELLIDGEATFASILEGIDQARDYILFQFFIVHDDGIGRKVKKHLIDRAEAGVRVHFLYDEVGSHDLPKAYLEELRQAGVEIYDFHTQKGPSNRFQLNFRNHRKIVVVDGRVAWVGGSNVGDEYLGLSPKFGNWRDTHVRIVGPAVLVTQLSFAEDWYWATGRHLDVNWKAKPAENGNLPVLIIPSGPADKLETANLMFVHAIDTAIERLWIASPYFVPDDAVITALQLAGLRGVDVRILIPDKPDHLGVYLAAFSYLQDIEHTGVTFYRYTDGFLHEKVMLIDDKLSFVGTANMDNRSFRLNFEITAVISDPEFAEKIEAMFEADFEKSKRVDAGEYDRRPWWFRFAVRLARLTAPIQ